MMKKLFLLPALLLGYMGLAQSGTITNVVIPTEAVPGSTINVSFDYTSDVPCAYEVQLIPLDASGTPLFGQNETYDRVDVGVAAMETNINFDVMVPIGITLSADLVAPADSWGWFIKLDSTPPDDQGAGDFADVNPRPTIDIVETLGFDDFARVDSSEMFFKNSSSSLVINTNTITSKSASIFDVTGKNVATITNLNETSSLDLSSLDSGLYILRTDDNKTIKFIR